MPPKECVKSVHELHYMKSETGVGIFRKTMENLAVGVIERFAQEFFRIIIPHQPKTMLIVTETAAYIYTAEVDGFKRLPENNAVHFSDGTYTGLGQALLCAIFLQEIDLKNGNIGLNSSNQVIKLDGDCALAPHRPVDGLFPYLHKNYELTEKVIAELPYLDRTDFYAFNWLDVIQIGNKCPVSKIVNPELAQSSQFRSEVNQAILKICLLPDAFIDCFMNNYMQLELREFFSKFIKERREQLKACALKNDSFVNYLTSVAAEEVAETLVPHINSFQRDPDTSIVPPEQREEMKMAVKNRLALLKILKELNQLVAEIRLKSGVEQEAGLQTMVEKIASHNNQLEMLLPLKDELTHRLSSISKPKAAAAKVSTASLLNHNGVFAEDKRESRKRKAAAQSAALPASHNDEAPAPLSRVA